MRLLLTGSGIKNPAIHDALVGVKGAFEQKGGKGKPWGKGPWGDDPLEQFGEFAGPPLLDARGRGRGGRR